MNQLESLHRSWTHSVAAHLYQRRAWISAVTLSAIAHGLIVLTAFASPPKVMTLNTELFNSAGSANRLTVMTIKAAVDLPDWLVAKDQASRHSSSDSGKAGEMGLLASKGKRKGIHSVFGGSPHGKAASEDSLGGLMGNLIAGPYAVGSLGTMGYGGLGSRIKGGGKGNSAIWNTFGNSRSAQPLPRSGVLASSFVGGNGIATRLADLLDRGVILNGRQVRLGAFQERGPLPYPSPREEAVALYAELEQTRVRHSGDGAHLQIALVARKGEAPRRPRMDIRLVLDRSGSMDDGDTWQKAITAALALIDRLRPTDTFGLISYADQATLDVKPGVLGQNRDKVRRQISSLGPGGDTNIGAALALAARHPPRRRGPGDVALVILLSDGRATSGEQAPSQIAAPARKMFEEGGVLTSTIGLGVDFDEETMLTVAREGSGSYHFVSRPSDIGEILQEELETRAQAVAQAIRVRVVLGEGVIAEHVYGSRLLSESEHASVRSTERATDQRLAAELGIVQDRQQENKVGLRIHIPTLRRGDQHVIVMRLRLPEGPAGSSVEAAQVSLEYKDLRGKNNGGSTAMVTAERTANPREAVASMRRPVKRTVLAFKAAQALQDAAGALTQGDLVNASRLLNEHKELLERGAEIWRDPLLRQDAALLRRYEQVLAAYWPAMSTDQQRKIALAMNYYSDQRMR